jgi:ABC-2 type transport system permease protein
MPIAELGYRHWEGKRTGALRRCLAIARSEVTIAFQSSRLLRRFLFVAWMPILYFCPFFLAIGYVANPSNELGAGAMLTELGTEIFPREVIEQIRENPELFLPAIWSVVFYLFFAWSQSFLSMIVVAISGPPLIARDHQTKAFLVYFSKPIGAWQYLLGKLATVVFFVFSMTLIPGIFLYLISIGLSPDAVTMTATLPVILKIALASLVTAVPIGLVVLLISSLTKDRRIATFVWMLLWIFGEISFRVLTASHSLSVDYRPPAWASLLSLRELTMRAVSGIFQVRGSIETVFGGLEGGDGRLSRDLLRLAEDMGDPAAVDRPRNVQEITDLAGLGISPEYAMLALVVISVACALLIVRRARKAVRI